MLLGKSLAATSQPKSAPKMPVFSIVFHRPRQAFPKLFLAESSNIKDLRAKKLGDVAPPRPPRPLKPLRQVSECLSRQPSTISDYQKELFSLSSRVPPSRAAPAPTLPGVSRWRSSAPPRKRSIHSSS